MKKLAVKILIVMFVSACFMFVSILSTGTMASEKRDTTSAQISNVSKTVDSSSLIILAGWETGTKGGKEYDDPFPTKYRGKKSGGGGKKTGDGKGTRSTGKDS